MLREPPTTAMLPEPVSTCPVCNNALHEHWRGRECLRVRVMLRELQDTLCAEHDRAKAAAKSWATCDVDEARGARDAYEHAADLLLQLRVAIDAVDEGE